ncbi:MAG: aldehyde dehydrogenase family protein [Francisellaceae bacterium]
MITHYHTINPATGDEIFSYKTLQQDEIDSILVTLEDQQRSWSALAVERRAGYLMDIANNLEKNVDSYASIMTQEMGKTFLESQAEVKKCASLCRFYAANGAAMLADETVEYDGPDAIRVFKPLGVIYSITPWNFPLWQVLRAIVPSLLIGNAVILKHAENVIGCGNMAAKLINECVGLDIVKHIVIDLSLSDYNIRHPIVKAVTITGSNRAGAIVAKTAGEVCKKSVLELGGSDPYIIRADADIEAAASQIVKSRMANAGQVCVSPKRVIVHERIIKAFEQLILREVSQIVVGDPMDEKTTMGPMARADLRQMLDEQVRKSIDQGARCLMGGQKRDINGGVYYSPTVLTDVKPGMVAFDEELFGPVIAIIRAKDDEEAIALANRSQFGLGSGVFSRDIDIARDIARNRIEAGMCFVNRCVASHPALPFGGIKQSGYGRECSREALRELANIKTVVISI